MRLGFKRRTMMGAALTVLVIALAAALVGAGGIVAWEYSNSNAFCTNMCHSVHPEEPKAHAVSMHARVNCVECHMGRTSTLHLMALKPTHINELWGMIAGYERPTMSHSLRPARESCEACHWPSARHSDTLRVKVHYGTDPKNTMERTTLALHTGFGEAREAFTQGIHWHIATEVLYGTSDEHKQTIPVVQVKGADGKVRTYLDASSGMTREQADKLEKRRIDCIDCHNASGHPFPNPADLVDEAMQEGRIDPAAPGAKARAVAIIEKSAHVNGTEEERGKRFDEIIAAAAPKGEQKADAKAADDKFAKEMKRILLLTSFAGKDLTWRSFPNNAGHKDFPGCFRCHDGKHLDEQGQAIRLQCTLCHALPQVVRDDGARSVASTVSPDMTPPDTHQEPNWMRDHRTKLDDSCAMCHGPLKWGQDGGNFCSNPACHGRKWPELTLDPEPPKPAGGSAPAPAKAQAKKPNVAAR